MIVVDKSLNVFILNPLTRSRIQLPSITSFSAVIRPSTRWYKKFDNSKTYYKWKDEYEDQDEYKDDDDELCPEFLQSLFFKKLILSHNPSLTGDYIVMAICGRLSRLACCRPGDDKWTLVDNDTRCFEDLIYWNQSFYALDSYRQLYVCDLGGKISVVSALVPAPPLFGFIYYLAISEEDLLLIGRSRKRDYYSGEYDDAFGLIAVTDQAIDFGTLKGCLYIMHRHLYFDFPNMYEYVRETGEIAAQLFIDACTNLLKDSGLIFVGTEDFKTELSKSYMLHPLVGANIIKAVDSHGMLPHSSDIVGVRYRQVSSRIAVLQRSILGEDSSFWGYTTPRF